MTKLDELTQLGQAVWLDYVRRSFMKTGELSTLVEWGVRGVTSNPTIFEKAIGGSADYDEELRQLVAAGKTVAEIYETLTLEDVTQAAAILRPVYDATNGRDGYVSLEVSPHLARDTNGTIKEAQRLVERLNLPNLMIKVPATPEGVRAIERLIGDGFNINVTLIFSVAQYQAVVEAYLRGLEKLAANGGDLSGVASVASFFVSRVDTAVDRALLNIGDTALRGRIAIANARLAYDYFRQQFSGERWEKLAAQGARAQRPLWASTGTKDPAFSPTKYADALIGPDTVNTMPLNTLHAFVNHGVVAQTLDQDLAQARADLEALAALGIDLDAIAADLQRVGVDAFVQSFEALMGVIEHKRDQLMGETDQMRMHLGPYQERVEAALRDIRDERIMARIWSHDHTVWKPDPKEITNRLGWLHIAEVLYEGRGALDWLVEECRRRGLRRALLLGMGGSSLAPEVFKKTFGRAEGFLKLHVLDSTDPGAVLTYADIFDPAETLYIVATKSGGTVETLSFFKFFYNQAVARLGAEEAGRHFVAITDPGSKLVTLADEYNFLATFLNDPNIGGRYSALSYFGLVAAAVQGIDLVRLLDRALVAAENAQSCNCPVEGDNNAGRLGAIMGELALAGRDKLTLITSPILTSFGDWVEQLVAESTGKEGKGILPVVGEPVGPPEVYGDDRLFVYLRLDDTHDEGVQMLQEAGHPVVTFYLGDRYDLGGQFFLWEMATAVASYRLRINPFNQPNVESAKVRAREMVAAYQEQGRLPELTPTLQDSGITVYGEVHSQSATEALLQFLATAEAGDYIAIQAYVQPTEENADLLHDMRTAIRDKYRRAVTVGFGPRFLHSTGQLHKGDDGSGVFVQITDTPMEDAAIPDKAGQDPSGITFGILKQAQALGDRRALLDADPPRRVMTFDLGPDVPTHLTEFLDALWP